MDLRVALKAFVVICCVLVCTVLYAEDLRPVQGPSWMVGACRNPASRDQDCRHVHGHISEHALHIRHRTMLPQHAVPHEVRCLPLLCRLLYAGHHLHRSPPARMQGPACRGGVRGLHQPLVLEAIPRTTTPRAPILGQRSGQEHCGQGLDQCKPTNQCCPYFCCRQLPFFLQSVTGTNAQSCQFWKLRPLNVLMYA